MIKSASLDEIIVRTPELQCFAMTLRHYPSRTASLINASWRESLASAKSAYVAQGRELEAAASWCLETIASAQDHFVDAFCHLKRDEFYEAWCLFERVEMELRSLARRYAPDDDQFGLHHMECMTAQFQSLYPYRMFMSPGLLVRRATCSICGEPFRLTGGCEHEVGCIYAGEMCCRVINEVDLLHMAFVENPVQKYSVPFSDSITYNYGPVHYVTAGLASPWHSWSVEEQERVIVPQGLSGAGRNELCPCGSGKKYKKCCLRKPRRRTHYKIIFTVEPPVALPPYLENANLLVRGVPESVRSSGASAN